MYYTGRLEVFNENFPAVSDLNYVEKALLLSFCDMKLKTLFVVVYCGCLWNHH